MSNGEFLKGASFKYGLATFKARKQISSQADASCMTKDIERKAYNKLNHGVTKHKNRHFHHYAQ